MIYLSGVKHEQLESILKWMYFGETNVYKDNIEEFIEIGKDLEVKELIKVAIDSQDLVNICTENVAEVELMSFLRRTLQNMMKTMMEM